MSVSSRDTVSRTCEHNYGKYMSNVTSPLAVSIVSGKYISICTETKSIVVAETNYCHATAIDGLFKSFRINVNILSDLIRPFAWA